MSVNYIKGRGEAFWKKLRKPYENEWRIEGINLIDMVPTYIIMGTTKTKNGRTIYRLRYETEKTLFLNPFYWAVYNFMKVIGLDPDNPFLYCEFVPYKDGKGAKIYESIYDRLYFKKINYNKGTKHERTFLFVEAKFFSNDFLTNYGFSITASARTVHITILPGHHLRDRDGKEIPADIFFYLFLLKIKYPAYIYYFNRFNGSVSKIYENYPLIINKKGRYKEWRF